MERSPEAWNTTWTERAIAFPFHQIDHCLFVENSLEAVELFGFAGNEIALYGHMVRNCKGLRLV